MKAPSTMPRSGWKCNDCKKGVEDQVYPWQVYGSHSFPYCPKCMLEASRKAGSNES